MSNISLVGKNMTFKQLQIAKKLSNIMMGYEAQLKLTKDTLYMHANGVVDDENWHPSELDWYFGFTRKHGLQFSDGYSHMVLNFNLKEVLDLITEFWEIEKITGWYYNIEFDVVKKAVDSCLDRINNETEWDTYLSNKGDIVIENKWSGDRRYFKTLKSFTRWCDNNLD